jgi:DNA/RNA endonuclease YhcR with UshA esterase domain
MINNKLSILFFVFCVLVVSGCATTQQVALSSEAIKPVSPAEAIKQIGKPEVLVEMAVKKAKDRLEKRGIIYLDSEEDFKDQNNLGVAISAEGAAKFKKQGILDPAAHFAGETIRVQGCVMRFEERPYLPVHNPEQISFVEKK